MTALLAKEWAARGAPEHLRLLAWVPHRDDVARPVSAPHPAPDYTRCPLCLRPLAEHAWQPINRAWGRAVIHYCPPEGEGSGSGAEGDAG